VSGIPACGPPDGAATFMLPASAKDSSRVKELDALLREAQQQQVFGFQDGPEGTVWNASPPKALKLDTRGRKGVHQLAQGRLGIVRRGR
jgi:hypothetical protein